MNPKIKPTKGNLDFFDEPDPFTFLITPSPQTDEPSSTMATGFRSSAPNARGMEKKSKDQGYLIVANGGGVQAQRTRSGDGMDGIHYRLTLWR